MLLIQLFKDARYFQIIFQAIFLSYGIFFLHWNSEYWLYATYFGTSLAVQFAAEYFLGKKAIPFLQRIKSAIDYHYPKSQLSKTKVIRTKIYFFQRNCFANHKARTSFGTEKQNSNTKQTSANKQNSLNYIHPNYRLNTA